MQRASSSPSKMPPYCGSKASPPKGRKKAEHESDCTGQIRAFGRRMARDVPAQDVERVTASGRHCGMRNHDAVMGNCRRQFRLYGVYPIVESRAEVRRRSFVAIGEEGFDALPRVRLTHPYTKHIYDGSLVQKKPVIFVSVVWEGVDDVDAAAQAPQERGGIGFAFGVLDSAYGTFDIVHVNLNRPYRRGGSEAAVMSSWIVRELVAAVMQRVRSGGHARMRRSSVTFTVDPIAPCFQLGNAQYMTERQSQGLEDMYAAAGFEVVPLPHEGQRRRTVRLVVDL